MSLFEIFFLNRTFELLTFFTAGIGSVLATAIFNVLNIDPVINAVISLDQCKKKISYVIIHLLKPPFLIFQFVLMKVCSKINL